MQLIRFTKSDGLDVFINPLRVSAVLSDTVFSRTVIWIGSEDDYIEVKEPLIEVVTKLRESK